MLSKRRSFGARKVSPPQPTCMSDDQKATYLRSLRNDRPARPTGSRPLPAKSSMSKLGHADTVPMSTVPHAIHREETSQVTTTSNRYSLPNSGSLGSMKGRPLVTGPEGMLGSRKVTPPEIRYKESTLRQKEKSEAQSIRQALEEMDFQDEEARIHKAAQLEAADLVWKHRNPESAEQEKTAPYRNPDLAKKQYVLRAEGSALDRHPKRIEHRSISDSSTESSRDVIQPLRYSKRSSVGAAKEELSNIGQGRRRQSSGSRKVSSGSSKGIFRNPEDQIYEEPSQIESTARQTHEVSHPLRSRTHNPSIRGSRPLPGKPPSIAKSQSIDNEARSNNNVSTHPFSAVEKADLPSRSQTPEDVDWSRSRVMEIRSDEIRAATSMKRSDRSPKLPTPTAVSDKLGRPIVSFDPSWKPVDRSARESMDNERASSRALPTRPLQDKSPRGSLDLSNSTSRSGWKKPTENHIRQSLPAINLQQAEESRPAHHGRASPQPPSISISAPSISITEPRVQVANHSIPSINIETNQEPAVRPLPSISVSSGNDRTGTNVNSGSNSAPQRYPQQPAQDRRLPWLSRQSASPSINGSRPTTVTCSACCLPISGRIVTASGASEKIKARFHPECFTCFHCSTGLECISFYPEPESSQLARLGLDGNEVDNIQNSITDADLRFYCHLDYHDLFSPRCASCHTPIEGAVIMAAGKSWHEGHFFCAECGDPFSSSSPFVESQGYAYCVGCHTKRNSARCKACKKQILDDVTVEALGGKWHEECFRCDDCGSDFGDEGRFFVREVEIDLTEKEKRKGLAYRKIEERAVCDGCEARRLKSKDVVAFL